MKSPDKPAALLRAIPSVNDMLALPAFAESPIDPTYLKQLIQQEIEAFRRAAVTEKIGPEEVAGYLERLVSQRLKQLFLRGPHRLINATGIVLHTNMGRAPLADAARQAISESSDSYAAVEVDVPSGKRGYRDQHVEELLCLLTGAESALIVNNCAAAILLVLTALCKGREVPVSRGELVEIGGSFRMPDVMDASGAIMVEIGTTNKTHLRDYQKAVGDNTAALLKVHTSNYKVMGFSTQPTLSDLLKLATENQLPLIYDLGSGHLQRMGELNYDADEPLVADVITAGVDVVTFSGDKMLGGPQAGIIAGKKAAIDLIRSHHLLRALRCDKLTYSAMAATLKLYLQPSTLKKTLPIAALFAISVEELRARGQKIKMAVKNSDLQIMMVQATSQVGSGAFPLQEMPSAALEVKCKHLKSERLAQRLRQSDPPIIGYIQDDRVLLNMRTVREDEVPLIVDALDRVSSQRHKNAR